MARLPVSFGSCRVSVAAASFIAFVAAGAAGRSAFARPEGAPSTLFSDQLANGCNKCHRDNVNTPALSLTASSQSITSGQPITLTFTVTTVNGNPGAAGFNIRSSQRGMFAVGGTAAGSAGTQVVTGYNGFPEATHTMPKLGEPATFTTLWTPGASVSGTVTFIAWGNAVNNTGDNSGDHAAMTTLDITVTCTQKAFFRDADGDGFGNAATMMMACAAPDGFVSDNTDCDDGRVNVHPGATEVCNGADDNCNNVVDEGLVLMSFYPDADHDGFGDANAPVKMACSTAQAGAGYVADHTDCNDGSAAVHPGAAETCNGVDDNCNGTTDENATDAMTFFRDSDGDGYGSMLGGMISACTKPAGYVAGNNDCNDGNAAVHPGAPELCNGIDDNCNGSVDEGVCPVDAAADTSDAPVAPDSAPEINPGPDAAADRSLDDSDSSHDVSTDTVDVSASMDLAATDVSTGVDRATEAGTDAPPATDTGATDTDTGAIADGARDTATADAGRDGGTMPNSGGGCSCRQSPTLPPSATGFLTLLLIVGLAMARRRRP